MSTNTDSSNIFLHAQREMRKRNGSEENRGTPRVIPMPKIESSANIKGPLRVTEEYKEERRQQVKEVKKQERREYEAELIALLAEKTKIESILCDLDPRKKKDNKKIAALNFQLRELNDEIQELQEESGIDLDKLEMGSKLGRFFSGIKAKARKAWKRIKKFVKKHKEPITGFLVVAIPAILGMLFKKLFRL